MTHMYSRTLDFDHLLHNFYNKELISKYFYVIIRFPLCGFNVMQPRSEGPSSPHPKMKIIVNNSIPALSLFGSFAHPLPPCFEQLAPAGDSGNKV